MRKGDAPRANSLLAGSARSAVPNPGGTAYTPFPAQPLDPTSTLHSSSPFLRRILSSLFILLPSSTISTSCFSSSFSLASFSRCPPSPTLCLFRAAHSGSYVSRSLLRCTKLQFIAVSFARDGVRPLFYPHYAIVRPPHAGLLALTTPSSHPPATPLRALRCTPCISLLCSEVRFITLSLSFPPPRSFSLALSFPRAMPPAIGRARRAEARRQAPQIRFSQLRLRSVGSEGRPEESVSMRRAALPASPTW